MKFVKLNPIAQQRLHRFVSIKRGYYSFILLIVLTLLAFVGELFINNKALIVKYDGDYFFPVARSFPLFSKQFSGKDFGEKYSYEADYRDLQKKWESQNSDNWIMMPIVPYGKTEVDQIDRSKVKAKIAEEQASFAKLLKEIKTSEAADKAEAIAKLKQDQEAIEAELNKSMFHPLPPDFSKRHFLGTDPIGRDIFALLVFGYRVAIIFSLTLLICTYTIGITIGCLMGYVGGWFDLIVQRVIEILSRVPVIYIMMIIATIYGKSFGILLSLMIIFGWMGITWQMRTATYKEKARDYIMAARSLGATNSRIVFSHIIPSTIALIVTFIPFSVSGGIVMLTSLDFIGFGLPPGDPSWGDLMKMGTSNMDAPWIVASVVVSMVIILFLVNMVGEAIREAFDPKKITKYE